MVGFPVWPAWRYRQGEARVFNSTEEFEAAGDGWVDSPAKIAAAEAGAPAIEAAPASTADDLDEMDKSALQAYATERGIEYDARWGRAKLIAAIRGE